MKSLIGNVGCENGWMMRRELFKYTYSHRLIELHDVSAAARQVAGFLAQYPLPASLFPKKAREIH